MSRDDREQVQNDLRMGCRESRSEIVYVKHEQLKLVGADRLVQAADPRCMYVAVRRQALLESLESPRVPAIRPEKDTKPA